MPIDKFLLRGWFNQGNLGDNLTLKIFEDTLAARYGKGCVLRQADIHGAHRHVSILAGGGCVDTGRAMDYALQFFSAQERSYLIGVGVNPVRDMPSTLKFQQILSDNYLMTVRDEKSAFFASQMGKPAHKVTADVCWLYKPQDVCEHKGNLVGIVYTRIPGWSPSAVSKFYMDLAAFVRSKHWRVCWISFGDLREGPAKIKSLRKASDTSMDIGMNHQNDFHLLFQKLAGLRYIINTRLHSVIMSYLAQLNSFNFMYSYKMEEMVKTLGLARYSAYAAAGGHVIKGTPVSALERFKHFWSESFHRKIAPSHRSAMLANLRRSAQLNFDILFRDFKKHKI